VEPKNSEQRSVFTALLPEQLLLLVMGR